MAIEDIKSSLTGTETIVGELQTLSLVLHSELTLQTPIHGIIHMGTDVNPSTFFIGTQWIRIAEDRTIVGCAAGETAGSIGGSDTCTITIANLPSHTHANLGHNHGRGTQNITGNKGVGDHHLDISTPNGCFIPERQGYDLKSGGGGGYHTVSFYASRTWSGASSAAQSTLSSVGSGKSFNITNVYQYFRAWQRVS